MAPAAGTVGLAKTPSGWGMGVLDFGIRSRKTTLVRMSEG
jgi:hypothetical protein